MKFKKKTAMIVSFALGTMLFATTALADMATKSGYDILKDTVKTTFSKASNSFDSFTLDVSMVAKIDGTIIQSEHSLEKYDRVQGISEHITNNESPRGKYSYYTYSDSKMDIRRSYDDSKYYVVEYKNGRNLRHQFTNPFEEPEAEDVERIIDAVVGNLKDHVMVNENPDGSKLLNGSLSEVQIPALVNAVVSLQAKQLFEGNQTGIPRLTKDIYVKEVSGNAVIDDDNILNSIMGSAILTGKDAQDQIHNISVEVLFEIKDINSTVVTKPDLSGAEVVTKPDLSGAEVVTEVVKNDKYYGQSVQVPEIFVGLFGNNIITDEDERFVKIGERYLEITSINEQTVTGRYYEVYKAEYEEFAQNKREFEFTATFEGRHHANFEAETTAGERVQGSIYFDDHVGKVNFHIDNVPFANMQFDYSFNPVLE